MNLAFSGTATLNTDYTGATSNVVISAGNTHGSITLTAIRDLFLESPDETIVVDIASVVNGTNVSPSQVAVTIADGGLIQPGPRSIGITFGDGSQGPAPTVLAGPVRQQHFWNAATWEDHWMRYYGPAEDGYGWVQVATKADDGSAVNVQYQNYWATYSGTCTAKGASQGTGSDPYLQTQGILMTCDEPARPENENVFSGIPFSIYDVYVSKNGVVTNYPYQSGGAWKGLGLWHEYSIQFIQFVASAPDINNEPGPKISDDGVETWLGGTLVHTGAPPTSVWVYWGTSDGGTNATSWGHTNYFGVNTSVVPASYALELRYLPINTMFHYRYYAECPEGGGAWAPSTVDFRSGGGTSIIIR